MTDACCWLLVATFLREPPWVEQEAFKMPSAEACQRARRAGVEESSLLLSTRSRYGHLLICTTLEPTKGWMWGKR